MTRGMLPDKSALALAEDLLNRFAGVDRALLLEMMTSQAFFAMRFGNKREERAACEWLNMLQVKAGRLQIEGRKEGGQ